MSGGSGQGMDACRRGRSAIFGKQQRPACTDPLHSHGGPKLCYEGENLDGFQELWGSVTEVRVTKWRRAEGWALVTT